MQDKCDILILTANFGNGHNSVSNAIKEYVQDQDENVSIKTKDIYEIIHPMIYKAMYKSYHLLVQYGHKIYNREYYRKNQKYNDNKVYASSKNGMKRLTDYIEDINPGLIISTFPTCTGYISKYKELHNRSMPLVTFITDVVDGYEWIYEYNDLYFVADPVVKEKLIQKGLDPKKLLSTGIPIRKNFLNKLSKETARTELGLCKEDFVLLMMGGSLGIIPENPHFYQWLDDMKNVTVVVLTGKNKGLYQKLKTYDLSSKIKVLDYTQKMAEYMKSSDLLVTKAGGITLFEAIGSKLPFIIYKPALGQEIENSKFIEDRKIGRVVHDIKELKEGITNIIHDVAQRDSMTRILDKMADSIDMEKMADEIISMYYSKQV